MRKYKYDIIIELTEIKSRVHWPMMGISKADAISKIDIMAPFTVISAHRVNVTGAKRNRCAASMAYVDTDI